MTERQHSGSVVGSPRAGGELRGVVTAVTDPGRKRSNNEDNLVVFDLQEKAALPPGQETQVAFAHPGLLVAVADGMGGHSSGQVASQLCVDTLPVEFLKDFPTSAAAETEGANALKRAVEATNELIYTRAREHADEKGMGSTLTSAWVVGKQAIVAHVGDSRAYHLHEGNFTQLTRDQTVLNSVSEEERQALLNTPLENMLLQAVGAMANVEVALSSVELAPGDFLLLCSDGLYRLLSCEQMVEVLEGTEPLQKKAESLIQKANDGGGPDNVTVILCEVVKSEEEPPGQEVAEEPRKEEPKKKVAKYEILEELGRGSMGVVYRARDPFIGRLVALKTITPGLLDKPELLQRFYREAQSAGGLQHPNIVIIYDLGEADGLPYIAMEFLEGESLEKIIARQPAMPLGQKLNIILQLCRGLDYAHKHGVVHRDIKPANVIVMRDGTVKVVDFGIARLTSTTITSTGMVMGTEWYMSPEQAQGERVDARSDLFSVGVVMYELFAYRKPFSGPNVAAVLIKIVTEEPPALAEFAPQVPPQLCEIVQRCLQKNPTDRFQSLEDLTLELEPLVRALQRDMVEELVQQAKELIKKQDYAQARNLLRNVLNSDSSHGLAKTLMAKVNTEIRRLGIHTR